MKQIFYSRSYVLFIHSIKSLIFKIVYYYKNVSFELLFQNQTKLFVLKKYFIGPHFSFMQPGHLSANWFVHIEFESIWDLTMSAKALIIFIIIIWPLKI